MTCSGDDSHLHLSLSSDAELVSVCNVQLKCSFLMLTYQICLFMPCYTVNIMFITVILYLFSVLFYYSRLPA